MNQKLRIISAVLVVVFTLGMGAVASAEDAGINSEEHNTTLKIDQRQLYRSKTTDGVTFVEYDTKNVSKTLFSGVYESENLDEQCTLVNVDGKNYNFWNDVKNSVDNIVVVKNISEISDSKDTNDMTAYVRTIFAFPAFSEENNELHLNFHQPDGVEDMDKVLEKVDGLAEINGQSYKLYVYNYSQPLAPGETTEPSLLEYVFDKSVTSEMIKKFGDNYEVKITSQAVQKTGFSTIADAFGKTFSNVTVDNHPWKTVEN